MLNDKTPFYLLRKIHPSSLEPIFKDGFMLVSLVMYIIYCDFHKCSIMALMFLFLLHLRFTQVLYSKTLVVILVDFFLSMSYSQ